MSLDFLWTEKYRPTKISDLVLDGNTNKNMVDFIENKEIPNLLFVGEAGSGKTTLAQILCDKILANSDNLLSLNGSDQRGIDVVRSTVIPFMKSPPMIDKIRIVFIDEADYLTINSFTSLRAEIQRYSRTVRFILTGNYLSKIPSAIQSRFYTYRFDRLPKKMVLEFCKSILEKEDVKFKNSDVELILDRFYPDVRQVVSNLQKQTFDKRLDVSSIINMISVEDKILAEFSGALQSINNPDKFKIHYREILRTIRTEDVRYETLFQKLFYMKEVSSTNKVKINKYANKHLSCLDPTMNFLSCFYECAVSMRDYIKLSREIKILSSRVERLEG